MSTAMTETKAPAPPPDEFEPRMRYQPPSVARGGFQAFVYRILEVVAQAGLVIITARLMEPSGRGLYALASLTATLCSLPLGSVWSASAIEVSKRREPLPELLGALMVISLVGGALIALVGFGVAATLGDRWWVVALVPGAVLFAFADLSALDRTCWAFLVVEVAAFGLLLREGARERVPTAA